MRPGVWGAVAALAVAIATLGGPSMGSDEAGARERYVVRREYVAPGIRLLRITDRRGPNRIRVLRIDPAASSTLEVVLATDRIPGHETTSSMAQRTGALAAINGDYTVQPDMPGAGRPVNLFARDGELVTSPIIWGRNFGFTPDETAFYFGHPAFTATLTQSDTGVIWPIDAWNESPASPDGYSVYTPRGSWNYRPPRYSCAARLYPSGYVAHGPTQPSVSQPHVVDEVRCAPERMPRRGGIVVAARKKSPASAPLVQELLPGETVELSWSAGWPGIVDTIGGNPTLIENGVLTVEPCTGSYFCYRNPRTGVGLAGGRVLLVTVDGRQPKRSVGMTPTQFGKLFQWLGADWALNLDGGGSTTMWVQGEIVNRPSDPQERPVGSALVVLPGSDPDEPAPGPAPSPTPSPTAIAVPPPARLGAPVCTSVTDPASTGGMLEALAEGAFGRSARLPAALDRVLEAYRRSGPCTGPRVTLGR